MEFIYIYKNLDENITEMFFTKSSGYRDLKDVHGNCFSACYFHHTWAVLNDTVSLTH